MRVDQEGTDKLRISSRLLVNKVQPSILSSMNARSEPRQFLRSPLHYRFFGTCLHCTISFWALRSHDWLWSRLVSDYRASFPAVG
jgi:hypothetical protein